jgi:ethanolamine utilization microcompartment shell protein EutS
MMDAPIERVTRNRHQNWKKNSELTRNGHKNSKKEGLCKKWMIHEGMVVVGIVIGTPSETTVVGRTAAAEIGSAKGGGRGR